MAQRTSLNRPYGLVHEDDIVRDITELYDRSGGSTTGLTTKVIEIGTWNMELELSKSISHGLSSTEWKTIRNISVIVRTDADDEYRIYQDSDSNFNSISNNGYIDYFTSSQIHLGHTISSFYSESSVWQGVLINRGWITISYIAD